MFYNFSNFAIYALIVAAFIKGKITHTSRLQSKNQRWMAHI